MLRVNADNTTTVIADLSAFLKTHPVQSPNADDFESDGTWYSMVAVRGALFAVEPNHGELDMITPDGQIRSGRVEEIASGLFLPTAMTFGADGNLYVSNVGFGRTAVGGGQVLKITVR